MSAHAARLGREIRVGVVFLRITCCGGNERAVAPIHERAPAAQEIAHLRSQFAVGVPTVGNGIGTENALGDIAMRRTGI